MQINIIFLVKKLFLFLFLIFTILNLFAQIENEWKNQIDSINYYRNLTIQTSEMTLKYQYNLEVQIYLEKLIHSETAMEQNYDSIKHISVLTSDDKEVRIWTWFIEKENQEQEYFGYIKHYDDKIKKYKVFSLNDYRHNLTSGNFQITDQNSWFGAVYYDIVTVYGIPKKPLYTLLGFNANDIFTDIKLIEVLSFKSNGKPQFGVNIFRKSPIKGNRIIFKYYNGASFNMEYHRHSYYTGEKDKKNRPIMAVGDLITFEQLIPMDEKWKDIPEFYVPESSLLQGFLFKDGKWNFIPEVVSGEDIIINGEKVSNPNKVKKNIVKRTWYQSAKTL